MRDGRTSRLARRLLGSNPSRRSRQAGGALHRLPQAAPQSPARPCHARRPDVIGLAYRVESRTRTTTESTGGPHPTVWTVSRRPGESLFSRRARIVLRGWRPEPAIDHAARGVDLPPPAVLLDRPALRSSTALCARSRARWPRPSRPGPRGRLRRTPNGLTVESVTWYFRPICTAEHITPTRPSRRRSGRRLGHRW